MEGKTNWLKIPGDVSINILAAVEKALAKTQRISQPPELGRVRKGIEEFKLNRRILTLPKFPIKNLVKKSAIREVRRDKVRRIRRELVDAGATLYGLIKSESRYLPKILHDNEHIEAIVYGQHGSSSAMLIATDERIIYLDKKPMTVMFDEVSYEVISGIEFDIHLLFAKVVLHTPVKNYDFRWVNLRCGEKFARYIEAEKLEREQQESANLPIETEVTPVWQIPQPAQSSNELKEDMAGYYWLPTEEEDRRKAGVGPLENLEV